MRNKERLYIVNYFRIPRPGHNPDPYHWALASGPKSGSMNGMLIYHVRNRLTPDGIMQWTLEEPFRNLSNGPDSTPSDMLTLTAVAKVTDLGRLQGVVRNVSPIDDANAAWQTFNCKTWVEQALRAIALDGGGGGCIGANVLGTFGWTALEQRCEMFANPIRQIYLGAQELPDPRPLQDLLLPMGQRGYMASIWRPNPKFYPCCNYLKWYSTAYTDPISHQELLKQKSK